MEYNIDILAAGCNTCCMHCYVNGGPAPCMPPDDFRLCLDRLTPAFERFGDRIGFTLDNEVYNHPDAPALLRYVADHAKAHYFHHGSTTGIALLEHPDRRALLDVLLENGWTQASFAVHGGEAAHDRIVARPGAHEALKRSAELMTREGFEVWLSLMGSRQLLADRAEVSALVKALPQAILLPVLPDYYPTPRLRHWQEIRCDRNEADSFVAFAAELGASEEYVADCAGFAWESDVYEGVLTGRPLPDLEGKRTAFFHVDHRLEFYLGNTGSALRRLGNIARMDPEEICAAIASARDNYYETAEIHYEDLRRQPLMLARSERDLAYPGVVPCLIAMLDNARR